MQLSDQEDFSDDDDFDMDPNCADGAGGARHDAKTITVSRLSRLKELSQRPEDDLSNDQRNEKKRIIRLEKNRRAAAMSRRKKKMYIKNLEERAALMAKHLAILEMENSQLKAILNSQNVNLPPPIVQSNSYPSVLQSLPTCENDMMARPCKKRKLNDGNGIASEPNSGDENNCLSIPMHHNGGSGTTSDSISPQMQQFLPQYSSQNSLDDNDAEITKSEDSNSIKMASSLPPPPPLLPIMNHHMPHGAQRLQPPPLIPNSQMAQHIPQSHQSHQSHPSHQHPYSFPHSLPPFLHNMSNNHSLPPVHPPPLQEGLIHGNLPPFVMPNQNCPQSLPPIMIKPENMQSARGMPPPLLMVPSHNIPTQDAEQTE